MKSIKKIAIIISWPREFDIYKKLINILGSDCAIIIDDLEYLSPDHAGKKELMIDLAAQKNINYFLLTEIIDELKFPVVISTGLTYADKFTFTSILFYIYSNFRAIYFYITSGGKSKFKPPSIFGESMIERKVAPYAIHYPKGLDITERKYPPKKWRKCYHEYWVHNEYEADLLRKELPDVHAVNIGHPKYDYGHSPSDSLLSLKKEFDLSGEKKTLVWLPTNKIRGCAHLSNISEWSEEIASLSYDYNIIVRPHPKLLATDPQISDRLMRQGFFVDTRPDRCMYDLINSASLVFVDSGASVLSSIYMGKKILILECEGSESADGLLKRADTNCAKISKKEKNNIKFCVSYILSDTYTFTEGERMLRELLSKDQQDIKSIESAVHDLRNKFLNLK